MYIIQKVVSELEDYNKNIFYFNFLLLYLLKLNLYESSKN